MDARRMPIACAYRRCGEQTGWHRRQGAGAHADTTADVGGGMPAAAIMLLAAIVRRHVAQTVMQWFTDRRGRFMHGMRIRAPHAQRRGGQRGDDQHQPCQQAHGEQATGAGKGAKRGGHGLERTRRTCLLSTLEEGP